MTRQLSSELDLEDFLGRMLKAPLRVMLERTPIPYPVRKVMEYQTHTDDLLNQIRRLHVAEKEQHDREWAEWLAGESARDGFTFSDAQMEVAMRVAAKQEASR